MPRPPCQVRGQQACRPSSCSSSRLFPEAAAGAGRNGRRWKRSGCWLPARFTNGSQDGHAGLTYVYVRVYPWPQRNTMQFLAHRLCAYRSPAAPVFLMQINRLFTTLGEWCACRFPVSNLYRMFTVCRSAGQAPGGSLLPVPFLAAFVPDRDLRKTGIRQPFRKRAFR